MKMILKHTRHVSTMICLLLLVIMIGVRKCNSAPVTINSEEQPMNVDIKAEQFQFILDWKPSELTRVEIEAEILQSSYKNVASCTFQQISRVNHYINESSSSVLQEIDYYPSTTYKFTIYGCRCQFLQGICENVCFLLYVITLNTTANQAATDITIIPEYDHFIMEWKSSEYTRILIANVEISQTYYNTTELDDFKEIYRINTNTNTSSISTLTEIPYYPSTTYNFSIFGCKTEGCIYLKQENVATPPLKPVIIGTQFCEKQNCDVRLEVDNVQSKNSSLYLLATNLNVSMIDFESHTWRIDNKNKYNIIQRKNSSNVSHKSILNLKLNDSVICGFQIFAIVVNNYEEQLNSSSRKLNLNEICSGQTTNIEEEVDTTTISPITHFVTRMTTKITAIMAQQTTKVTGSDFPEDNGIKLSSGLGISPIVLSVIVIIGIAFIIFLHIKQKSNNQRVPEENPLQPNRESPEGQNIE